MIDRVQTVSYQEETPAHASLIGTIIAGRYKLRQEIGEGGMGSVYLAEQIQPVKRQIALKLIKPGMDSKAVLARFESERQALALMDHPHIAKVLDAGTTEAGRPFFVMELVKGIPLTDYCDQHRFGLPQRLTLFSQICSAIQHAHQKGIIHRDLKPTNILVESHDGAPVPKVIDFGLAKATSGLHLTDRSLFTAFGSVAGTPLYMAPEQASFNALDIDTRADIYSLGVILYELLTGSTPIRRETFRQAALEEMLRLIRDVEPPTPSSRISTSDTLPSIAATRQTEPARLSRFIRGDLDWIVMKALAKERNRRYESAIALAQDLERFTNHEPVDRRAANRSIQVPQVRPQEPGGSGRRRRVRIDAHHRNSRERALALWANRQRVRAVNAEEMAKRQQARAQDREKMAIAAVKRYADVVRETPALQEQPRAGEAAGHPFQGAARVFQEAAGPVASRSGDIARLACPAGVGESRAGLPHMARSATSRTPCAYEESLAISERLGRAPIGQRISGRRRKELQRRRRPAARDGTDGRGARVVRAGPRDKPAGCQREPGCRRVPAPPWL